MRRRRPKVGDVVQLALPDGRFAYGRALNDGSVAFYTGRSDHPGKPPIGSRDYEFVVGVYDDVVRADDVPIVGHDPSRDPDDDWPPPFCMRDPITGAVRIYHHGTIRSATEEEVQGLEIAAVWDRQDIIDRLARMPRLS